MDLFKGDIVYVNLNPIRGSETGKIRPCIIIQKNIINKNSPTTIVAIITGRDRLKKKYPSSNKSPTKKFSCGMYLSISSIFHLDIFLLVLSEMILKFLRRLQKKLSILH